MDTKELLNEVVGAVEKAVPDAVNAVVDAKMAELEAKSLNDINDIKAEIKKLSMQKKLTPNVVSLAQKTAVVGTIKDVFEKGVKTEKAFMEVAEQHIKTMSEGTSTEGAELVFDQFEADILKVINSYQLVNMVKILPLAKGDKVSLPKATNGVTTTYVSEGNTDTATEPATSFVSIDIFKAYTLTKMTEELLEDTMTIPDLYNLIVEFIGESQAEFLENQILNGVGTTAVEWILVNSSVNEVTLDATETGDDIADADLVAVVTKAAQKFKTRTSNVAWIMSQYIYGKLMSLKTTANAILYPELRNFANPSLMGYKVIISDKMTVQNSAQDIAWATTILFGDLSYFTLARRKGLTIEQGYTDNDWAKGIRSIKSNSRFGGKCTFGEAFTKLSNGSAS